MLVTYLCCAHTMSWIRTKRHAVVATQDGPRPKVNPAASSVLLYIMYRSEHRAALKKT